MIVVQSWELEKENHMRYLLFVSLVSALILRPAASAQDSGIVRCSEHEVLILLNSLIDLEVFDFTPIETVNDAVSRGTALLETRENSLALLPLCAEAIAMQRQKIMNKGDLIGQTALRLAGVPDGANPYTLHFPNLLEDEKSMALNMITGERNEEIQIQGRHLPSCSRAEMNALDALSADFDVALTEAEETGDASLWIIALDQMLNWRIDNMPQLPDCLEAIELGYRLSKATADAAAQFALRAAEVAPDDNPYIATLARLREELKSWRDHLRLTLPENQDALVIALGPLSQLPACSLADIEEAHSVLQNDVLDLIKDMIFPSGPEDLKKFAARHLALRNGYLARAPHCAETFEGLWLTRQALGDLVAWSSLVTLGYEPDINPFDDQVQDKVRQLKSWIGKTEDYLESVGDGEEAAPEERELPACRDGEVAYMIGYAMDDFDKFMTALFDRSDDFDVFEVIENSFTFRDRLWTSLPRCRQALAVGMAMRQIVGDLMASISVSFAGVGTEDNPYIAEGSRDRASLDDLRLELLTTTESAASSIAAGNYYYVTANPYANIRACASTNCEIVATARYGEGLTVVDDSSDWYEVRLDDGQTAFIAGFLMSDTPPDA